MQAKQLVPLGPLHLSPAALPCGRRAQQAELPCRDGWLEYIFLPMFAHLCLTTLMNSKLVNRKSYYQRERNCLLLGEALDPTSGTLSTHSFPLCPLKVQWLQDHQTGHMRTFSHRDTLCLGIWASRGLNFLLGEASPQAARRTTLAPLNPVSPKHSSRVPALKLSYNVYFSSTSSKLYSYCYKYSMFFGSLLGKMSGSFVMS